MELGFRTGEITAPNMKRKQAPSDSDSTFVQLTSSTDGGGGSSSYFGRVRPQGSKRAMEDRRLTNFVETVAHAQATAIKAMADATLKKAQVMDDQNVFMLMTYAPNGVISATGARWLKLRQKEELRKLEARLAESRARKESIRHSLPAPIPVEGPEAL